VKLRNRGVGDLCNPDVVVLCICGFVELWYCVVAELFRCLFVDLWCHEVVYWHRCEVVDLLICEFV